MHAAKYYITGLMTETDYESHLKNGIRIRTWNVQSAGPLCSKWRVKHLIKECLSALSTFDGAMWHDTSVSGEKSVKDKLCVPSKAAVPTRMTFSMSLDGHQWNIPVESYFFTFSSMLSICSLPGMKSGSCLIEEKEGMKNMNCILCSGVRRIYLHFYKCIY